MHTYHEGQRLVIAGGATQVWIEPWGPNSLRVRMTAQPEMDAHEWALTEPVPETDAAVRYETVDATDPWYHGEEAEAHRRIDTIAYLTNGKITARVNAEGWISFLNQKGEVLTEEYWRTRDRINRYCVPLRVPGRELKPLHGVAAWELAARFEAYDDEMIFGMGQYQDRHLNKKGSVLELAHRNSQASVPFFVSSRGYGFLWNNPAIGTAAFGTNVTEWTARSTTKLDYFITAGDTPAEIEAQYTLATGRTPMMPEYGMGYWQCRLRYRNQAEVLEVARHHKALGLPLDVIVIDFFHWTMQGDFRFDPVDFPDPEGMIRELRAMGIEPVVSVWPTIDSRSVNFGEMSDKGYLVNADRGMRHHMDWLGNTVFFDATHPGAQRFVWEKCKENYYDKGIRCFWLDEAEPEYGPYDFDNYRYYAGPALQTTNTYPVGYAKAFWDGLRAAGETDVMSLIRCAWAGSQKYAVLPWSGDIHSSFRSMREQLQAGLSMAMAGIPWWTCDIGGFVGGDPQDPGFRELLVRWFQWAAFLPVFRMHGERDPLIDEPARNGVGRPAYGQPNELWSFGDEVYQLLAPYLHMRERLRPYIRSVMQSAHDSGAPVIRPLFFDFPQDKVAWQVEDSYMFGPDLLVSPILESGASQRRIYLPIGADWVDAYTGQRYPGGQTVTVPAPLGVIPVMLRNGAALDVYPRA